MSLKLNEIDFNNIAIWPKPFKIGFIVLCCAFILFLGYWFDFKNQHIILENLTKKEIILKKEFESKQKKAVNLKAYEQQMVEMKETYGQLLRQLPEKTEVPALVEDISHQGLAAGLDFESIKLLPEKRVDFYAELGMDIIVTGTFHQLANFVSSVANLPRIVTLHNFKVVRKINKDKVELLKMTIKAKTYRYIGDEDDK